jgi:NADPH2:quinone reductase
MLALRCTAYGPPEDLVVEEVPDPEPGPLDAVVRVEAASANFPDVLIAQDRYQISVPVPFTPGSELAGTVERVGRDVRGVRPGDRVRGSTMVGAFAQRACLPAASLSPVPQGVSFADAAAFWVVYATAYHSLRSVAEVRPGEWVAVLGAAGGVGLAAVDVAQVLGARVLAAASSDEKLALCASRGASALVNYVTEDLKTAMKELTGGADVVIDPVGGAAAELALRATRWGGRFVTVGFASGEIPRIPLNLVLLKGVTIRGFDMRSYADHHGSLAARDREELIDLFDRGQLRPMVSATYPLARAGQALASLARRQATGKVVITPWDP